MKKCYVTIHVWLHDMDHNINLNYRRKIRPISGPPSFWWFLTPIYYNKFFYGVPAWPLDILIIQTSTKWPIKMSSNHAIGNQNESLYKIHLHLFNFFIFPSNGAVRKPAEYFVEWLPCRDVTSAIWQIWWRFFCYSTL